VGSEFDLDDLYSKGRERPKTQEILPYYQDLASDFFPDTIGLVLIDGAAAYPGGVAALQRRAGRSICGLPMARGRHDGQKQPPHAVRCNIQEIGRMAVMAYPTRAASQFFLHTARPLIRIQRIPVVIRGKCQSAITHLTGRPSLR